MKFYHFTAKRFLESILRNGLTKGHMLISFTPLKFVPNKQWLTVNPVFEQSWLNPNSTLPYKRNEVRVSVNISDAQMQFCKPWSQMQFLCPAVAKDLSAYGDPENWYVFDGIIKPEWISDPTVDVEL